MSRLATKPLPTNKADVSVSGSTLTVKGPKGTLTKEVHPGVRVSVDGSGVSVSPTNNSRLAKALVGTYASHVKNMIRGVETPYIKKLVLDGVGYRMEVKGNALVLTVGFSHPVSLPIPSEIKATVDKNVLTLESINKESVGQFAANVRRVKPPEPYLGKGIHYEGEVIRRKQGKKAV